MKNFYEKVESESLENPNYGITHVFKPNKHILLCGKTGSGKSNVLLNILERMKGVFINVILCTKDAEEPLYVLMRKMIPSMRIYEGMVRNEKKKLVQNTPILDEVNEKDDKGWEPSLVIFDDCVSDSDQQKIGQFFIRGRKRNITCIYLSQSYYGCPKIIRLQCNNVLLKQGIQRRDLAAILRETSLDYDIKDLVRVYNKIIKNFEDFLNIDLLHNKLYLGFETNEFDINNDSINNPKNVRVCKSYKSKEGCNLESTLKKESVNAFVKDLFRQLRAASLRTGEYLLMDIYDAYMDWCDKTNHEIGTKNSLSRLLSKNFHKRQSGGKVVFCLE